MSLTSKFLKDRELPLVGMDAADLQDLVENRVPDDVVDYHTIMVSGGKLQAGWAVPKWKKYTVTHADLTAAATSQTLTLFTLAAGEVVVAVVVRKERYFVGGGLLVLLMQLGVTGDTDLYRSNMPVSYSTLPNNRDPLINFANAVIPVGGTDVVAHFTSTSAVFVNAATAGEVDIYFLCSTLS